MDWIVSGANVIQLFFFNGNVFFLFVCFCFVFFLGGGVLAERNEINIRQHNISFNNDAYQNVLWVMI